MGVHADCELVSQRWIGFDPVGLPSLLSSHGGWYLAAKHQEVDAAK